MACGGWLAPPGPIRKEREKWPRSDLNRGPSDYESPALTAELQGHMRVVRLSAIACAWPSIRTERSRGERTLHCLRALGTRSAKTATNSRR